MRAPRPIRIESGCYVAAGTRDDLGKPYIITLEGRQGLPGAWVVRDSRDREVSRHFTLRDALESQEAVE